MQKAKNIFSNHQKLFKDSSSLILFVILLTIFLRLIVGPRTVDDSYITFRYARNILAGNGFVYNLGERVLGTTTPLYTGLMVGFGFLTGGVSAPFPVIALIVNAIADGVTCWLFILIGRRLKAPVAGILAAFVWAVHPYSVTFATGGLETSVYVLLLTGTIFAYLNNKLTLTALFSALSILTRPDALILIGLIGMDRIRLIFMPGNEPIEKVRISEILAFLVPILSWILFASIYFGNPLPHSIAAKSAAYHLPRDAALIRLIQHFATPFMGHKTFGIPWIGVGMVLYPTLFIIGSRYSFHLNRRIWAWVAYPIFYFAIFSYFNPLIFRWYLTPPLPSYIFLILVGGEKFLRDIFQYIKSREKESTPENQTLINGIINTAMIVVILIPLLFCIKAWVLAPDHGINRPAPEMAWYKLELLYIEAANYLETEIDSHAKLPTVAAGDIGALGYFTSAQIFDTLGLVTPESTPYYPTDPAYYVNAYAVSPDLINDFQPDYVVLLEVYGREGLFKDPRFLNAYKLRLKIPTDIYDSDGMLIFEKKTHEALTNFN